MPPHTVLACAVGLAAYLLLLAVGRWLKRRAGVPLDARYQFLCLALAAFAPFSFLEIPYEVLRGLLAAVVALGMLVLIGLLRKYYWEEFFPRRYQAQAPAFLRQVANLHLLALAAVAILYGLYDLRVPGLLAGSGIAAIVLGLAVQETLGNILAGYGLHAGRPFRRGDWIIHGEHHAEVMEINWRSTRLRTTDNVYLDIPNSHLARQTIINFAYPTAVHAMRLHVGVDYEVPPNRAKDALLRAATKADGVLPDPPPKVFLQNFGESAIIYEVKFWISDHSRLSETQDAIRTNAWYEFKRAHIRIPFPTRTVHIERKPATPAGRDAAALQAALRQQPLFQCLDEAQRDRLVAGAEARRFGRGERIIEEGAAGESMFVLLAGEAEVSVQRNGHTSHLALLQAGACFGEMSLLTGARRSATVTARDDCEVLEFAKDKLAEILRDQPAVLEQLSQLLARRRLETDSAMSQLPEQAAAAEHQEYATTFLSQVRTFFEL